jgi:hypothetical protein
MVLRGVRHESEVLVRQVDGRLVTLRSHGDTAPAGFRRVDLEQAERVAHHLRLLVASTAQSSAVDRARVRAAVHYFVGLHNTRGRRRQRSLAEELRVVDDMVRELADVTWG